MLQARPSRHLAVFLIYLIIFISFLSVDLMGFEISGIQTGVWTMANNPYYLTGTVIIPENQTLYIEPGVVVLFKGNHSIKVNGQLNAVGSLNNKIIFTAFHDQEFNPLASQNLVAQLQTNWNAIEFTASSLPNSRLEYCIFRYSDNIIIAPQATPTILNILIADCQATQLNINGELLPVQAGLTRDYYRFDSNSMLSSDTDTPGLTEISTVAAISKILEQEEFSFGEVSVITASRTEQKLIDAPADIIVIDENIISARGYKDLKDILRDLPGFDVSENLEGEVRTLVISRGILGNNKILVLRDGKKLNPTTGERFVYGNNIPLFNVQRVEIIYGPSSALYGADAYAGIINLISKNPADINGMQMNMSYGVNNTLDASVLYGKQIDDDISLFIGGRGYISDGLNLNSFDEYANLEYEQPIKDYNIYGKLFLNNAVLGFYRMDANEPNGPSTNPEWFTFDETYVWHQVINKIFLDHKLNREWFELNSSLEYSDYEVRNESCFKYTWGYQYKYAKTTAVKLTEQANFDLNPTTKLAIGLSLESIDAFPKTSNLDAKFNPDLLVDDMSNWYVDGKVFGLESLKGAPAFGVHPFTKFGIYGELTKKLLENFQVNLGVRYDRPSNYRPENIYDMISPRLGLIWNPSNTNIKLIYGEGYIQPSEYYKWENFVAGQNVAHIPNPELASENIQSIILTAKRKFADNFLGTISCYRYNLRNVIRPVVYTLSNSFVDSIAYVETNDNQGKQITQGFEIKLEYRYKNADAYLNYSFLDAREEDETPIPKIAPNKIHCGIHYHFSEKLVLSPRLKWSDGITTITGGARDIKNYTIFDLSLQAREISPGLSIYLTVKNLFNQKYYAAAPFGEETAGWIIHQAPQPVRTAECGFMFRF